MAASGGKIGQVHVVHDENRVRPERVEEELVKCFFECEGVVFGGGFHEIPHAQKDAAHLLVQFLQDGGFAAANAAPQTNNRSDLDACQKLIEGHFLGGTQPEWGMI
jgi:hypothetical protein